MLKRLLVYSPLFFIGFSLLPLAGNSQFTAAGGELSYKFLYQAPSGIFIVNYYEVTVKLYKECLEQGDLPTAIDLRSSLKSQGAIIPQYTQGATFTNIPMRSFYITKQDQNSCSPSLQAVCY